ncbi:hypothetical protein KY321_04510 [Candidatus Woesearchaeota archaeon]|nr:hypothetical protein [Candidatus Woesearchaeota archaeon]
MKESLNSNENLMEFNLLDFIDDYSIEYNRRFDLKKELIRDFTKLENKVKVESLNELGNKQTDTYFFFQQTTIDHETLDVKIKLNDDIYKSVSSIPEKNYFQFLKKEAIMIANKKMTPNDIKLLMYLKSKSHNAKESYVKINIEDVYTILGKTHNMYFATLKERYIEPFIERALENTNYVISYEVQKNRLNKRKLESILFRVDNRKEKANIINHHLNNDTEQSDVIAQKHFDELEPEIESMNKHEQKVKASVNQRKVKSLNNSLKPNDDINEITIKKRDNKLIKHISVEELEKDLEKPVNKILDKEIKLQELFEEEMNNELDKTIKLENEGINDTFNGFDLFGGNDE